MPHSSPFSLLQRLDSEATGFAGQLDALLSRESAEDVRIREVVREILADVRKRGDVALVEYTNRFDRTDLVAGMLRVPADYIAGARVDSALESALELAADRIRDYHERLLPGDLDYTDESGIRLGARWTAVDAAGLYVPGGKAAYPSSVLMNAIPAKVAGVSRIVMVVPTPDEILPESLLVAARIAGVDEIYTVGGAQAVAALAFGTETISPVNKIVGPGNAYVAEAKRQVFGIVGIDTIAGPSEILVVADAENDPAWIAADLLSQAEHDEMAQSILITDDDAFADQVEAAIAKHLEALPRADIMRTSLKSHGAIITVPNVMQAAPIIDRIAAEHVELAVSDPDALLASVRHGGAFFLGRHTPEALGDYVAGPNHVLPTSGTAAFASGLSVTDFMKRSSILHADQNSIDVIGPAAEALARAEGLQAHGLSVSIRRKAA